MRIIKLAIFYAILFIPLAFMLGGKFFETKNLFYLIAFVSLKIIFFVQAIRIVRADSRDNLS